METEVHAAFTALDWTVVVLYLLMTTWIGHRLRGKQGTIRDFFLGGRTLPWPAVTGSVIATEISALTFIGVPGTVFAVQGDFTYLQWALGSIMARFAVGYWLVPMYYEREIYSPYDFMGHKLGFRVKQLVTVLFTGGAILGQSVRVLVTAIILKVVTGMPIEICILIIGVFAIAWTFMGGMRTVIWTDVVQFFLFLGGGLLALIWITASLDGGWGELTRVNRGAEVIEFQHEGKTYRETIYQVKEGDETRRLVAVKRDALRSTPETTGEVLSGDPPRVLTEGEVLPAEIETRNKLRMLDTRITDETGNFLVFTFWIAIFAMPFQNFAAFGTDQLMAQRIFCCRGVVEARRAVLWSSLSQFITVLMLLVSAGLYAWYQSHPIPESEFELFAEDKNNVFPVWITTVLPAGLSGLLIAGAFAAAISSLDSILAALSQTTLSLFYGRDRFENEQGSRAMVWRSRMAVVLWGIALSVFAIMLNMLYQRGDKNLIDFAFRMLSYTYGPMLGILLLAVFPVHRSTLGILIGTLISIVLAALILPDVSTALRGMGLEDATPQQWFAWPWLFPINAGITFLCGWGLGRLGIGRSNEPASP